MIKLRYEQLSQRNFQGALAKLANVQIRSPEAFRIKHLLKEIQQQLDAMKDAFRKDIAGVYAVGGNPENMAQPGTKSFELGLPFACIEGKEEDAKKAMDDFSKRECEVKQKKLTGELLISVSEWSAAELAALDPVLVDIVAAE